MSDEKFTATGNIQLVKNAPRDKAGKRTGRFSQPDQSINTLAAEIGFDAYCIYHFMLNNAGGNFWYTAKALASVFRDDKISESRISKAIAKLCNAGLLEKEKTRNNGIRPQYQYKVYEISTQIQLSKQVEITRPTNSPLIDTSDFSADEIEFAINTNADAKTKQTPIQSKPNDGNAFRNHIKDLCRRTGAGGEDAQKAVIECCRLLYRESREIATDNQILRFIDRVGNQKAINAQKAYEDTKIGRF